MSTEEWRPVVGHEDDYEVSSLGRVRSRDRVTPHARYGSARRKGQVLKQPVDKRGYPVVNIQRVVTPVHVLVLEAFHEPRPEGMVARHLNDVKEDNRAVNLAWGTPSDNMQDRLRNGLHHYASLTHCSKGHEFTPENTFSTPSQPNSRRCRTCHRESSRINGRKYRARERSTA